MKNEIPPPSPAFELAVLLLTQKVKIKIWSTPGTTFNSNIYSIKSAKRYLWCRGFVHLPSLFPAFALFSATIPLPHSPPLFAPATQANNSLHGTNTGKVIYGNGMTFIRCLRVGNLTVASLKVTNFPEPYIQPEALYKFTGAYMLMFICFPTMC